MTAPESSPLAGKPVQRIFKSIHQLLDSSANVQTFVIDSKIPRGEMETQLAPLHPHAARSSSTIRTFSNPGNSTEPPVREAMDEHWNPSWPSGVAAVLRCAA
ncbi:hypothetical protein [Streptomyces sp. NRRL S-378]|uniref:hypothetical protein n=1 Tax=Streptomyces sp. NRRL S-378 TaxID=1463904 RepID=UPI0004CA4580|nr:hypothetical protein [Streptomyces sp. NRRL S-378]